MTSNSVENLLLSLKEEKMTKLPGKYFDSILPPKEVQEYLKKTFDIQDLVPEYSTTIENDIIRVEKISNVLIRDNNSISIFIKMNRGYFDILTKVNNFFILNEKNTDDLFSECNYINVLDCNDEDNTKCNVLYNSFIDDEINYPYDAIMGTPTFEINLQKSSTLMENINSGNLHMVLDMKVLRLLPKDRRSLVTATNWKKLIINSGVPFHRLIKYQEYLNSRNYEKTDSNKIVRLKCI